MASGTDRRLTCARVCSKSHSSLEANEPNTEAQAAAAAAAAAATAAFVVAVAAAAVRSGK